METTELAVIMLLGAAVLFLFLLLVAVVRMGGCLQRIERVLGEMAAGTGDSAAASAAASVAVKAAHDSAFAEFLREDPARKKLPKREQFEAYRAWRRDKGLNWSAP